MIKFFRHIRQSLIEQNKMGKYLKYAIGEILLVVVGILIALGINNWNENRKNRQNEIVLLKKLQEENNLNIEEIKYDSLDRQVLPKLMQNFNVFLKNTEIEKQTDSLQDYLWDILSASAYTFTQNNLVNYVNSHKNSTNGLNRELGVLQASLEDLVAISTKSVDLKLDSFFKSIGNDVDFSTMEIKNFDKLKSLAFRNDILLLSNVEAEVTRHFNGCLRQMRIVDSLIMERLKQ